MQPDDKDAALLPRRINGCFALLHRPVTDRGAHIWISFSPDRRNWGRHTLVLPAGSARGGMRIVSACRHRSSRRRVTGSCCITG